MKKIIIAGLLSLIGMVNASATTLTFDDYEQAGTGYVPEFLVHVEQSFFIAANSGFLSAQQQNTDAYAGSAGLFNIGGSSVLYFFDEESPFTLNSIDLARGTRGEPGGGVVNFVGFKKDGSTVEQSFTMGDDFAFQTFRFTNFIDVVNVMWIQTQPSHQVDNIVINDTAAVPEPGSLALLGLGLAGFVAARRRKQQAAV